LRFYYYFFLFIFWSLTYSLAAPILVSHVLAGALFPIAVFPQSPLVSSPSSPHSSSGPGLLSLLLCMFPLIRPPRSNNQLVNNNNIQQMHLNIFIMYVKILLHVSALIVHPQGVIHYKTPI
jgi:hypothetical protein